MGNYAYKALNLGNRKKQEGIIPASTEMEARAKLREMQLSTLSLEEVKGYHDGSGQIKKKTILGSVFKPKIATKDILAFSRNMAIMIRGGIPITEALLYFENFSDNITYKMMIQTLRKDLLGGLPFSEALAKFPEAFSDIFVNLVKAGENSGELDTTLERVSDLMERSEKLKSKIVSTAIYPLIILVLVFMVMLLMFYFVLPSFENIYKQLGIELPLLTKIMIFCSNALRGGWFISFPAMALSIWGALKFLSTPYAKQLIDKNNVKIPVLKEVVRFANVSSFVSTLGVCFTAGIPITEGIDFATSTVNNEVIRSALVEVNKQVQTGRKLGTALAETGVMPELVLLILATGEESGNLEQSLQTAQEYLEKEVDQRIGILMTFMEPLLLLFLGVVVGTIAMSIYMPLFGMYEHIGS